MRYEVLAGVALLAFSGCAEGETKNDVVADTGVSDVAVIEVGADTEPDATTDGESDASADGESDSASDATTASDADANAADTSAVDSTPETETDASDAATDSATDSSTDATGGWSHTVAIDGTNDFTSSETFSTTSPAYAAYVTWDANYVYWGISGADIGTSPAATKWLFFYLDTDPTAATGATTGVQYNTEKPAFPSGFGAEYYARWKTDNSFQTLEHFSGGSWSTIATVVDHARSGNFVEFRLKRSDIGSPAKLGISMFMLNETGGAEAAYAGLYSGSFTDGYHASIPITKYLYVDFTVGSSPNDSSRIKP